MDSWKVSGAVVLTQTSSAGYIRTYVSYWRKSEHWLCRTDPCWGWVLRGTVINLPRISKEHSKVQPCLSGNKILVTKISRRRFQQAGNDSTMSGGYCRYSSFSEHQTNFGSWNKRAMWLKKTLEISRQNANAWAKRVILGSGYVSNLDEVLEGNQEIESEIQLFEESDSVGGGWHLAYRYPVFLRV